MSKPRIGRPSPALIVAVVALVMALGGTAAASGWINGNLIRPGTVSGAKLKARTVGGGKLRVFTGGLVRPQTLAGNRVKPDTLTGKQIKESTLGTVPSATHSATATAVAGDTRYNLKLGFGQAQTLATAGPLTLTAQCAQNSTNQKGEAGMDLARVVISTTEAGATFTGSTDSKTGGASGTLDPTTPGDERVAVEYSVATGASEYLSGGFITAYSAKGAGLVMPVNGSSAAIGMFGTGCVFQGAVFGT